VEAEDTDLEDVEALGLAARGDREAFAKIVSRHQAAVYRLALALTPSASLAEDVLQETFISAYRHAASFRGESSVRTWLMTIARNAASRIYRRRVGEPMEHLSLHELGQEAGWGTTDDPERLVAASERRHALREALETLSEDDRAVIVLRDLEGLSGPEAADVLKLPLPTMKTRLHRARLRLMAALKRGGVNGP